MLLVFNSSINICMHVLQFIDDTTTSYIQDINTFTFATQLMLRGVYSEQPSDDTLVFASSSDLDYAILAYNGNARLEVITV
jgi:hypothetical protein